MSVALQRHMSMQPSLSIMSNSFTLKAAQFNMPVVTNYTVIFGIDYVTYQDSICFYLPVIPA